MDSEGTIEKLRSILLQIMKKKRDILSFSNFQVRIIEKMSHKLLFPLKE
jgi:hypothetical protein